MILEQVRDGKGDSLANHGPQPFPELGRVGPRELDQVGSVGGRHKGAHGSLRRRDVDGFLHEGVAGRCYAVFDRLLQSHVRRGGRAAHDVGE